MFRQNTKQRETGMAAYAAREDFCSIFDRAAKPLYLLAFLLTAKHAAAEQCFVEGFGEAIEGNAIFQEWALSWSRRVIIKMAIRIVKPAPGVHDGPSDSWPGARDQAARAINAVANLPPMERFVFVLSVLERYSEVECGLLLGCTGQQVRQIKIRALQQLGAADKAAQRVMPTEVRQPVLT